MREEFRKSMVNELVTEILGLHALNCFSAHNSSSRAVMFGSHISQRLVLEDGDEKILQTGVEQQFGRHTFSIKMPHDGRIIKIIPRYPKTMSEGGLNFNPETLVVYEIDETKQIDCFIIPYYASYHQFFGFKYVIREEGIKLLKPNSFVPKGTVFADSPSVGENFGFKFGINANVAFMAIPSASEDGIMVCRDFLKRLRFRIFEHRVIEFGGNKFPIYAYGDKPFPDIGEHIRQDGILGIIREYDSDMTPINMSIYDMQEHDVIFDKPVYVRGAHSHIDTGPYANSKVVQGRVVDVKMFCNNIQNKNLPEAIKDKIVKYDEALKRYHQAILDTEEEIRLQRQKKDKNAKPNLSRRFHRLNVESLAITNWTPPAKAKQPLLNLQYRKTPLDEVRMEFVIEYILEPNIGFKMTGIHGD